MNKFDICEMVTNLIVERLEAGVVPWQMRWKTSGGMPRNLVYKKLTGVLTSGTCSALVSKNRESKFINSGVGLYIQRIL